MSIQKKVIDPEKNVNEYTLDNGYMKVSVLNYGGIITKIIFPDKKGKLINCVLDYADYTLYIENPLFLGAVIGPVAGRIQRATFELDQTKYSLEANDQSNHLHGGSQGFHRQFFQVDLVESVKKDQLVLSLRQHSTPGYPGSLDFQVTYTLDANNCLTILYAAKATEKTVLSPTNHTYFNLNATAETIANHTLTIDARYVQEITTGTVPTGNYLDLTLAENQALRLKGEMLDKNLKGNHPQLTLGAGGIDLAYVLDHDAEVCARLKNETTGIELQMTTTEESVVVYTGNNIAPNHYSSSKGIIAKYGGVTLETQALPDKVHQSDRTGVLLLPNEPYRSQTSLQFLHF